MKCPHCLEETHMFDRKPRCINPECAAYDSDAHDDWTRNLTTLSDGEERQATRTIEVELTDEELIDLGERLAQAIMDAKDIPNKLKALRSFINESSFILQEKKEMREVSVTESFDFAAGMFRCLYQGQIIEERPLTQDEKQMRIQG